MQFRKVFVNLIVDPRKLTEYALNPDNPIGADKATVFEKKLGYTRNNYEKLLQQIQSFAWDAEAILKREDEHGQRYQVDLEIAGLQGQTATVRTGWIVEPGANFARLVTLYVRKQG
ncbi:MAG: hypothetical protein LH679_20660 [Cyanobacteria bacterium CAN_BIN43]|nr:hypothetical protein [Cyanobacteria bacterium CAN_BIN43]